MSKLFVDEIVHQSSQGSGTITLGASGETVQLAAGATQSGFGGVMTPAFYAQLSANTTITNDAYTKIACNTEVYDSDGCYDNSTNYRFTPTTAGKYFVFGNVKYNSPTNRLQYFNTHIYKNGSMVSDTGTSTYNDNYLDGGGTTSNIILDMNGTTDYVELYGVGGGLSTVGIVGTWTGFGAYKIIE